MRALLIVNPNATSTTRFRRDVIVRALASEVELEVLQTRYRGHAARLAATARASGRQLVITLGGDGTANEAVNGILGPAPQRGHGPDPARLPALAPLPGGSANVLTRALGLPSDPVDAAGQVLQALGDGRHRSIGLGLADGRYFTFNAGVGIDAEVVRAVEGRRAGGLPVTPSLYVRMALRQFYRVTDRRHPALTLERPGCPAQGPLFLGFISNTAPWTYLGRRSVTTSPEAGFDTGLDLFALRSLSTLATARAVRQMLSAADRPPRGRSVLALHDEDDLTFRAIRPVAVQVDGEYVGERDRVRFQSVPDALRVVA